MLPRCALLHAHASACGTACRKASRAGLAQVVPEEVVADRCLPERCKRWTLVVLLLHRPQFSQHLFVLDGWSLLADGLAVGYVRGAP